jgi:hypothetical protein
VVDELVRFDLLRPQLAVTLAGIADKELQDMPLDVVHVINISFGGHAVQVKDFLLKILLSRCRRPYGL